jgi:hypothetical protein
VQTRILRGHGIGHVQKRGFITVYWHDRTIAERGASMLAYLYRSLRSWLLEYLQYLPFNQRFHRIGHKAGLPENRIVVPKEMKHAFYLNRLFFD